MKTVWNIISVIAVANLLALAGVLLWLKSSDRLDTDRARALRELFSTTVTSDKAKAEAAAKEAEAAKALAEAEAKANKPPLTASEKLQSRVELTELDEQRMQRVRREVEDLRAALAREREELDKRWTQLETDRKAFEQLVADSTNGVSDEQFRKSLDVLQGLKAPAAKQLLVQMLNEPGAAETAAQAGAQVGAPVLREGRMKRVTEYLNAMDERARGRIMAEFTKDDPALAAELLDALRRHGQFARADGAP
jgi:flagellar basal body-associated protein FliL